MKKKFTNNILTYVKLVFLCILVLFLYGCSSASQYYYESAVTELDNKNFDSADNNIKSALKEEPNKAEYLICSGLIDIGQAEYDVAVESFSKAISTDGNDNAIENNKNAYRGLGIAYICLEKYDEAIKAFDNALAIEKLPEINYDIYKYKADALMRSKNYENAINVCEQLISEDSSDADGYIQKCICQLKLKKFDEAQETLKIIAKYTNDTSYKAQVYAEISTALVEAKDYKKAIEMINEISDTDNKDAKKILMKNEIASLEGLGKLEDAYKKAQSYVKVYTDDSDMNKEVKFLETRVTASK